MNEYDLELIESRFFRTDDESKDFFLYPIAREWWSRRYEYIWASHFTNSHDVCLDAACGTCHHFKFFLGYNSKEVHCCDLDNLILDKQFILNGVMTGFGKDAFETVDKIYDKLNFKVCDLSSLPYEDKKFDKIYCISVLEHLSRDVLLSSLKEFNRVLKDDGLLILTFDYPAINLNELSNDMLESKLAFVGPVDFNIPTGVLESYIYPGLKCFRAVLKIIT